MKYRRITKKHCLDLVRKAVFNLSPSVAVLYTEHKELARMKKIVHKRLKKYGIGTTYEDGKVIILENGNTISFTEITFI